MVQGVTDDTVEINTDDEQFDILEAMKHETITIKNPTFEDSCKILGGEYKRFDGIEVCSIRRGLEAYTLIRKDDGKVEVLSENAERLSYVNHIEDHSGTVCMIHTYYGIPVESECGYYNNKHILIVKVRSQTGSVIASKYGMGGFVKKHLILSTIGRHPRKDYKVMRVSKEYLPYFQERYTDELLEVLSELERENNRA